jgi:hypothetical protein
VDDTSIPYRYYRFHTWLKCWFCLGHVHVCGPCLASCGLHSLGSSVMESFEEWAHQIVQTINTVQNVYSTNIRKSSWANKLRIYRSCQCSQFSIDAEWTVWFLCYISKALLKMEQFLMCFPQIYARCTIHASTFLAFFHNSLSCGWRFNICTYIHMCAVPVVTNLS